MTLVKICGITNIEDAIAALELGADYLGLIFAESPRKITPNNAKQIMAAISEHPTTKTVRTVGVFTEESDDVLRTIDECRLDYAQLHGGQTEAFAKRIGGERVIRVVRVRDEESVDSLSRYSEASFYLLDTFRKELAGGTGETFDWELAIKAKSLGKPIILAGGLAPANIYDAVITVQPYAVDISSGVEASPGKKNHDLIKELIDNVRAADDAS